MILNGQDLNKRVFLIAEAGVNHEGSMRDAERLIVAAKESGADAVKFQTYFPSEYIARSEEERFARVSRFALSGKDFNRLAAYANRCGILFFSTPLDRASVDILNPHVPFFKISSGDMDFEPLVRYIASKKKPLILSTGGATLAEIKRSLGWIKKETSSDFLKNKVAVMHCIAAYPAPLEEANLNSIRYLSEELGLTVGYSDHTPGIEAAPLAVAAGARLIEKHFTLSREGKVFRDHFISTEPSEFGHMAAAVRRVEQLLGQRGKPTGKAEGANIDNMRRGIAAKRTIRKGERISASDLLYVRPQRDFTYQEAARVTGRVARNDIAEGHLIQKKDLGGK